jgi:enoyl-CoA hydratase
LAADATFDPSLARLEFPMAGCALVTLDRAAAMNALSLAMRRELVATIDDLQNDPLARVLIVTGAGKSFCAGLDLKELGASRDLGSTLQPAEATDPVAALRRFPGPVIGAINGAAVTGGFEMALACDLLVASETARFADTHARVGVLPGWGLSQRLPRLIGVNRAKELSLTGNFLSARQAESWGLVNRVVEPDRLLAVAFELAKDMLSAGPEMLVAMKRLIDDGAATTLDRGLEIERERSRAWSKALDPAAIEARRKGVISRGRESP